MSVHKHNIMLSYKIDMGSNGNIMPLHVYKKLFPNITNEQLAKTKDKSVLLKTYNKTTITQLVPRNGQALLGMPDTDVLNIIKINIDSIGAEDARDSEWYANMDNVLESDLKQGSDS